MTSVHTDTTCRLRFSNYNRSTKYKHTQLLPENIRIKITDYS
jgi:hypothetical protein